MYATAALGEIILVHPHCRSKAASCPETIAFKLSRQKEAKDLRRLRMVPQLEMVRGDDTSWTFGGASFVWVLDRSRIMFK